MCHANNADNSAWKDGEHIKFPLFFNSRLNSSSKKKIFLNAGWQTVVTFYCGSDVGVGFAQLLPQALRQGRHRVLGGAVEMCVSAVNNTMSAHAAKENMCESRRDSPG